MSPPTRDKTDALVALIVRDVCETDPADANDPNTVSIAVGDLEHIVKQHLLATPVADAGDGECKKCGAPTDPDYGHVGDCRPAADSEARDRLLAALERAAAAESELRALKDAADSEVVAFIEHSAIEVTKMTIAEAGMMLGVGKHACYTRPFAAAVPEVDDAMVERACAARWSSWYTPNVSKDEARSDMRRILTAALTPAPRRIEREDAPTVDDGMGVGS
jgi:hypothetical protein